MANVYLTHTGSFTARHGHGGTLAEEVHSHTFSYEITLYGPLNNEGYLLDFRQISAVLKEKINCVLEGKTLNDLFETPTTEIICVWIFNQLKKEFTQLQCVKLAEAPDRWITYTGDELCRK